MDVEICFERVLLHVLSFLFWVGLSACFVNCFLFKISFLYRPKSKASLLPSGYGSAKF